MTKKKDVIKRPLLPKWLAEALKIAGKKTLGILLLALGLALIAALFSYIPSDSSLNTSSAAPVHNIMGYLGAISADLLWQMFGLAAVLPAIAFAVWGGWLITGVSPYFKALRVLALLLALAFTSIFCAGINLPLFWPVVAGAEGMLGMLCFNLAWNALHYLNLEVLFPFLRLILTAGAGILALLTMVFAIDFPLLALLKALSLTTFKITKALALKIFKKVFPEHFKESDESEAKELQAPSFDAIDEEDEEEEETDMAPVKKTRPRTPKIKAGEKREGFTLPSLDFLSKVKTSSGSKLTREFLEQQARKLENVLREYGVDGEIVNYLPGPVVTLYELNPASGIKSSRVINLADDIARSMSALSVRISVIPGKSVLGIELPNETRETVFLRELLDTPKFKNSEQKLSLALGKDIGGTPYFADLVRMPHLLVAGTTGSGKSVAVNTMILSLLYRLTPQQCRLIMIDPKMLELSVYNGIPHLLSPVVTEAKKAIVALKWAVREMEDRYRAMSQMGVRNIDGYNKKLGDMLAAGETPSRTVQVGFDDNGMPIMEQQQLNLSPLPHIVVVVDEMADLMLVAGKEVEAAIQRLAQMARAAGIHLIMATQRPSVDVITGTIKANFPSRISFQVTSKIDSRTILGEQGAEQLLGRGDMLFMEAGQKPIRIHGPFVSDSEVEDVVNFLRSQGEPEYVDAVTEEEEDELDALLAGGGNGEDGDLYSQAINIVRTERKISISYLQRQLKIGYNRAADIVERMEKEGLVSAPNRVGKREILIPE